MKIKLGKNDLYNGSLILVNANNPIKKEFKRGNLAVPFLEYEDIVVDQITNNILREALTAVDGYSDIVPVRRAN